MVADNQPLNFPVPPTPSPSGPTPPAGMRKIDPLSLSKRQLIRIAETIGDDNQRLSKILKRCDTVLRRIQLELAQACDEAEQAAFLLPREKRLIATCREMVALTRPQPQPPAQEPDFASH